MGASAHYHVTVAILRVLCVASLVVLSAKLRNQRFLVSESTPAVTVGLSMFYRHGEEVTDLRCVHLLQAHWRSMQGKTVTVGTENICFDIANDNMI